MTPSNLSNRYGSFWTVIQLHIWIDLQRLCSDNCMSLIQGSPLTTFVIIVYFDVISPLVGAVANAAHRFKQVQLPTSCVKTVRERIRLEDASFRVGVTNGCVYQASGYCIGVETLWKWVLIDTTLGVLSHAHFGLPTYGTVSALMAIPNGRHSLSSVHVYTFFIRSGHTGWLVFMD